MGTIAHKIALIVGSARSHGNGAGLASWISTRVQERLNTPFSDGTQLPFELVVVNPTTPPLLLGPVTDGLRMPAQIRDPSQYSSPLVQQWSRFVTSCSGFIVLSPEYNGSYPGELKNALDHLYWEWRDKPAMMVTYGGRGGPRSSARLGELLDVLKMRRVGTSPRITLPKEYTGGDERVPLVEPYPAFLTSFESVLNQATEDLMSLVAGK